MSSQTANRVNGKKGIEVARGKKNAFNKLKNKITNPSILAIPHPK